MEGTRSVQENTFRVGQVREGSFGWEGYQMILTHKTTEAVVLQWRCPLPLARISGDERFFPAIQVLASRLKGNSRGPVDVEKMTGKKTSRLA